MQSRRCEFRPIKSIQYNTQMFAYFSPNVWPIMACPERAVKSCMASGAISNNGNKHHVLLTQTLNQERENVHFYSTSPKPFTVYFTIPPFTHSHSVRKTCKGTNLLIASISKCSVAQGQFDMVIERETETFPFQGGYLS